MHPKFRTIIHSFPLSSICFLLAILLAPSAFCQDGEKGIEAEWTPVPPTKVPWGNVNLDDKVNFVDLGVLARHWSNTDAMWNELNSKLLGDLALRWNQVVPYLLQAPYAGARTGQELRALPIGKTAGEAKQISSPLTVGMGVEFENRSAKATQPIYEDIENIALVSTQPDLMDPQIGDAWDGDERWVPVEQSFHTTFAQSYAEEADFKSLDLSLEIQYALFNGALSSEWTSRRINRTDTFKFLAKTKVDFGWFYDPNPVVRENVLMELLSPDPNVSINKYGTHYVFAQHRFAELYIDVVVQTQYGESTDSLQAELEASYGGLGNSASFSSTLESLATNKGSSTNITVEITTRGGPNQVTYDGVTYNFPILSLRPGDDVLENIEEFMQAWRSAVGADNAVARDTRDFYLRPLTDFIPGSFSLPFERTAQLRNWFETFVAFDERLELFQTELLTRLASDSSMYAYRGAFKFFNDLPMPTGLDDRDIAFYGNNLNYHTAILNDDMHQRARLLTVGRTLFENEDSGSAAPVFDPRDPDNQKLEALFPRVTILLKGSISGIDEVLNPDARWHSDANDTNFWEPRVILLGDFTDGSKYSIDLEVPQPVPVTVKNGPTYRPESDTTIIQFYVDYDQTGAPEEHIENITKRDDIDYTGFGVYLIDTSQGGNQRKSIGLACYNPYCWKTYQGEELMPWTLETGM